MVRGLINANVLNDGLVAEVQPGELMATAVISSVAASGAAWSNAAFALKMQLSPGGVWVDPPEGALTFAAADNRVAKSRVISGAVAVRLEPTTIETTGGATTPFHVLGEISLTRGAVTVAS